MINDTFRIDLTLVERESERERERLKERERERERERLNSFHRVLPLNRIQNDL